MYPRDVDHQIEDILAVVGPWTRAEMLRVHRLGPVRARCDDEMDVGVVLDLGCLTFAGVCAWLKRAAAAAGA
jgi:hypothetical protein